MIVLDEETVQARGDDAGAQLAMPQGRWMRGHARPRVALGAVAVGAIALGAFAVGALAIGRLAIGRASVRRLVIDELVVRKLQWPDGGNAP